MNFENKTILITGGTGSLGKKIVERLISGEQGNVKKIVIFSRDEDKHYQMSLDLKDSKNLLEFRVGDVRDYDSVLSAMRDANIIIHAAAMKQVPLCEYFPQEAINTNVLGISNIVRAIKNNSLPLEVVAVVSTDKACQPVSTYGMTKALQEKIAIESNISINKKEVKVVCVRYGNVMASRGSIIPLFQKQILNNEVVTITCGEMTRFMMTINNSIDTIFTVIYKSNPGEIYIPKIPAARISDIVNVMTEGRGVGIKVIGIRPGEKIHESLISIEESIRTVEEGDYFVITPFFPELVNRNYEQKKAKIISSEDFLLSRKDLNILLEKEGHLNF